MSSFYQHHAKLICICIFMFGISCLFSSRWLFVIVFTVNLKSGTHKLCCIAILQVHLNTAVHVDADCSRTNPCSDPSSCILYFPTRGNLLEVTRNFLSLTYPPDCISTSLALFQLQAGQGKITIPFDRVVSQWLKSFLEENERRWWLWTLCEWSRTHEVTVLVIWPLCQYCGSSIFSLSWYMSVLSVFVGRNGTLIHLAYVEKRLLLLQYTLKNKTGTGFILKQFHK